MTTSSSLPYIGSKISLITNAGIRYEGILYNINTKESTVGLANVRTFGSEGRKMGAGEVPPKDDIYDYIVFRGRDIKDITVSEPAPPDDPAIVAITPIPAGSSQSGPPQHMDSQMLKNPRMGSGGSNYMMPGGLGRAGGLGGPQSMMGFGMDGYSNPLRRDNLGINNRSAYGNGMNVREDYRMDDRRGNYGQSPFMSRRGGYQGGMTNGRGRTGFGPRRIIGELTAQPNQSLKSQVEEAFNFEESNSKFEKGPVTENVLEGKENTERSMVTTGVTVYDKKNSFFDNISCETLDRQAGHDARVERSKQRQLDVETFGQAATAAQARGRGNRMPRRVLNFRRPQTVGLGPVMGGGIGGYMNGYPYGPRF